MRSKLKLTKSKLSSVLRFELWCPSSIALFSFLTPKLKRLRLFWENLPSGACGLTPSRVGAGKGNSGDAVVPSSDGSGWPKLIARSSLGKVAPEASLSISTLTLLPTDRPFFGIPNKPVSLLKNISKDVPRKLRHVVSQFFCEKAWAVT